MSDLLTKVREAYRIATVENLYRLDLLSDEEVAVDMLDCDADIEGHDLDDVVRCVAEVRKEL